MAEAQKSSSSLRSFVTYLKTTLPGGPNGQTTAPTAVPGLPGAAPLTENARDGSVEQLLNQPPRSPTGAVPGMETGQVQALGVSDIPFVADALDRAKKEVTASRKATVIIRNKSAKVLRL